MSTARQGLPPDDRGSSQMKIEQARASSRRLVQRTSARLRVADDPSGTHGTDPGQDGVDPAAVTLLVSSPLFDADWYATIAGCSSEPDRAARHYLRQHPEAAEHEHGPLAHYVARGAAEGWAPNRWYQPCPEQPRGLADWSAE